VVRALSPDGRWLARPVPTSGDTRPLQVEIVNAETGTIGSTLDLAVPPAAGARGRVWRSLGALAFTAEGRLLVAYRERASGPPGTPERHVLIIETRSAPDWEPQEPVVIDLNAALPPPKLKYRVFPSPGPLADALRDPVITFSADRRRVTIF